MWDLTETEVKVLEAALNNSTYKQAAKSLEMKEGTYNTYLTRVRRKVSRAKKFLNRMRRYDKVLYKQYRYEEEEKGEQKEEGSSSF